MNRLLTGIAIAVAALVMSGGLMREAGAEDGGAKASAAGLSIAFQAPVVNGLRSERVLSLVLALEALRAAPALLDGRK